MFSVKMNWMSCAPRLGATLALVVKDHANGTARALPARSRTEVLSVAVYCVEGASAALGVNVAVLPETLIEPLTTALFEVTATEKFPVVSVPLSIASEKVAVTVVPTATPVAPARGVTELTVGGVVSGGAVVVKVHVAADASPLPARSCAPVVIVAVYCVLPARDALGVNVAVLPDTPTVPLTGVPLLVTTSVNVEVVSVALFIGSENVTITVLLSATLVAPMLGKRDCTVGGVVSGGVVVVKTQLKLPANALPARSCAPVVMVAVY